MHLLPLPQPIQQLLLLLPCRPAQNPPSEMSLLLPLTLPCLAQEPPSEHQRH